MPGASVAEWPGWPYRRGSVHAFMGRRAMPARPAADHGARRRTAVSIHDLTEREKVSGSRAPLRAAIDGFSLRAAVRRGARDRQIFDIDKILAHLGLAGAAATQGAGAPGAAASAWPREAGGDCVDTD